MIPKAYRLNISSSSSFIGTKGYGKWCLVISRSHTAPQWLISVSKKIDNRATVRNKLRRQISQWLYLHREDLKQGQFLIIPRHKPANKADLNLLFEEIKKYVFTLPTAV